MEASTFFHSKFLNENGGHWSDQYKSDSNNNSSEDSSNENSTENISSDNGIDPSKNKKKVDPQSKEEQAKYQKDIQNLNSNLSPVLTFLINFITLTVGGESSEAKSAYEESLIVAEKAAEAEKAAAQIKTVEEGSFSVIDWKGYPQGGVKPEGPFRLLEGAEYTAARNSANIKNAALRRANPEALKGLQIHEIHPVKFGGSPTDMLNKTFLTPKQHSAYTNYWNSLMRNIKK
ncbi:hypothetical protein [Flavobacterium mesophilum]|uniref:hypothetical protein n=1 Tax=Flavobacterium mesophilum TaxID=3143495 RepID=UPI0031DF907F